MSVTLSQSSSAAFPDRGEVGLEVTLDTGSAGRYLLHDLGTNRSLLHTRLLVDVNTASGAEVRIAGAQTPADHTAWSLELLPDAAQVRLHIGEGTTITADLVAGLAWHCLEVKLDASNGEATLWQNGRVVGSATGAFAGLTMRHAWLGGVAKSVDAGGTYYLDEWQLADHYIGPITVSPSSLYADDPARWLVLYNTSDAESGRWAGTYRAHRGIPYANLLGLALSTNEVIGESAYADLAGAVNDYLTRHSLTSQILGIVCGYRVPGYVDTQAVGTSLRPVASLLARPDTDVSLYEKPQSVDVLPDRPDATALGDSRLTARIDAPDRAAADAMLDRADALIANGLGDGDEATLWFDPVAGSGTDAITDRWRAWLNSVDRMRTRLPVTRSDDGESYSDANFQSINNDGFLWAWPLNEPDADGFFQSPAGSRVLSLQLHTETATATTARQANATNWIQTPHQNGYAAAVAGADPFSTSLLPAPRPLFEALRLGWTLGEAWHLSQPWLRGALYLVGDPLMTVALPRAGWNVYGPLTHLNNLTPTKPAYALRASQTALTLPAALKPGDSEVAYYLIRQVDAAGREEASASPIRLGAVNGQPAAAPLPPIWPLEPDWPVWVENQRVHLRVVWDRALNHCQIQTVELRGQIHGADETTIATPTLDDAQHHIALDQPLPTTQARYRWRFMSADGVALVTPWSALVSPADHAAVPLAPFTTA